MRENMFEHANTFLELLDPYGSEELEEFQEDKIDVARESAHDAMIELDVADYRTNDPSERNVGATLLSAEVVGFGPGVTSVLPSSLPGVAPTSAQRRRFRETVSTVSDWEGLALGLVCSWERNRPRLPLRCHHASLLWRPRERIQQRRSAGMIVLAARNRRWTRSLGRRVATILVTVLVSPIAQ